LPLHSCFSWHIQAESFNEKVFLTSINDPGVLSTDVGEPEACVAPDAGCRPLQSCNSVRPCCSPPRFTRVKQLHGQIGGVVQTLNDKIAKVLQKQEKEFLAAYRAHMYQVLRNDIVYLPWLTVLPVQEVSRTAGSKGVTSAESSCE
jgi:hypothetical protein